MTFLNKLRSDHFDNISVDWEDMGKTAAEFKMLSSYVNAANAINIEPATFQAILWHTWKRMYPPALKRSRRHQWSVMGEA